MAVNQCYLWYLDKIEHECGKRLVSCLAKNPKFCKISEQENVKYVIHIVFNRDIVDFHGIKRVTFCIILIRQKIANTINRDIL